MDSAARENQSGQGERSDVTWNTGVPEPAIYSLNTTVITVAIAAYSSNESINRRRKVLLLRNGPTTK